MLERLLEKIGLAEKEAKVYLASLELSQATVQQIAGKAGLRRPTTYVILEKLMNLGLVSTTQVGKKTMFVAENPNELENIIETQKRTIDAKRDELNGAMNQLMAIYNLQKDKPVVRYFEGADGLVALDRYGRDLLHKNSEILAIAPIDLLEKNFTSRREKSIGERVKLGIKSRTIYTHEGGPLPEEKNKAELRETIYLPKQMLPIDATMTIYPNWGIKLYYLNVQKPFGIAIESAEFARNMKAFFELAWLGAKSINHK